MDKKRRYGWFTEGFDTADWQATKALLEDLGTLEKLGSLDGG